MNHKFSLKHLKLKLQSSKTDKAFLKDLRFKAEPLAAAFQGKILDKYTVDQATVYVVDQDGKGLYIINEPKMSAEEQRVYSLLMENLFFTLKPIAKMDNPLKYVEGFMWNAAQELGAVEPVQKSFQKIRYFLTRDAFGYGQIHVPMNDPQIEEVSCTSYGKPIAVIHRQFSEYDWLQTNVAFTSEDTLKSYVQKLAQRTGQSVTVAVPYCYSHDTEVLTLEGFKQLKDITFEDEIATLNPETTELEYQKPVDIQKFAYTGKIIHFSGQCYDLLVTPEHRMYTRPRWSKEFRFVSADKLASLSLSTLRSLYEFKRDCKWTGSDKKYFILPAFKKEWQCKRTLMTRECPEKELPMELWLRFFGWWIAEGCTTTGNRVLVSNSTPSYIEEIVSVERALGFNPQYGRPSPHKKYGRIYETITIRDIQLWTYLRQFGKAKQKFIPKEIKELPKDKLAILFEAMIKGDGRKSSGDYRTASKRLADDMQEIGIKLGITGSVSKDKDREMYCVSFSKERLTPNIGSKPTFEEYEGNVYDVTVPKHHIILVRRNGKPLWSSNCDAMSKEGHRLAVTFAGEVTLPGSTFCIRKFPESPLSMAHLLKYQTLTPLMAAYFWLLTEYKGYVMVLGPMGSGKTSLLNSLLTMIDPTLKIASIEDTAEVRIPHSGWQRFKARHTYSITESRYDIGLFDLVKLSLRYRPDYIVVGEVRGEEIKALTQAASLGHGALATFHAENPEAALVRMRSPPMEVSEGGLMLIGCFTLLNRVRTIQGKVVRRVLEAVEVEPKEGTLGLKRVFTWNARTDTFTPQSAIEVAKKSLRLKMIRRLTGWTENELTSELDLRAQYLTETVTEGKLEFAPFSEAIRKFYVSSRRHEKS